MRSKISYNEETTALILALTYASVLLSYGNSSQPGSKHAGDQLQLLSEKKLRPALLEKSDVLKNLEKKEIITISPNDK